MGELLQLRPFTSTHTLSCLQTQTHTKLYLVLEFINGGHLFFNLYRQGVFDETVARLYTAEIVSAIGYLHSIGIMHRGTFIPSLTHSLHSSLTPLALLCGSAVII